MQHPSLKKLCGLFASAVIALVLVGCKGSDGRNGQDGAAGTPGTPGPAYAADITTYSPDDWAGLTLKAKITRVTPGNQPVVNFTITDGHNLPLKGFGQFTSKTATAQYTGYPNLGFAIAKLVPGTAASPDRWVSYMVTNNPTAAAPTTWNPTKPTTDNIGTLVDNGDGSYAYTFRRDISQIGTELAKYTYSGNNVLADLDDVSYQPTLTHRITLYVGGIARGTGDTTLGDRSANSADGSNTGVKGVYILNPANDVFDFIPSTGAAVTSSNLQKEITSVDKCFTCHAKFEFHGGGRQDTRYCVVCHTDQRKYGIANATVTVTPGAAADHSQDTIAVTGESGKFRGLATGDFTSYIHRLHRGEMLNVKGYGYPGVGEATYPQDLRSCVKCHTASTATPQGDNWFNKPSRLACGGCHDKIDFATGYGHWNPADGSPNPQLTDANCAGCHTAAYIKVDHVPVVPPNPGNSWLVSGGNTNTNASFVAAFDKNLPPPAKYITWDLKSVTLNSSQQPVFTFRFLDSTTTPAVPIVFNAAPASADGTVELFTLPDGTQFVGGPSVYLSFAMPQDGIQAPADPNATISAYIRNVWNKTAVVNTATQGNPTANVSTGTMTGPDGSGYYALTLTAYKVPTSATLLTGGIGYTYGIGAITAAFNTQPLTQVSNLSAGLPVWMANLYTYTPKTTTLGTGQGGLSVPAPNVWKAVSGTLPAGFSSTANVARRKIVDDAKCNACHGKMGVFTEKVFHAGQRNNADSCVWCHNTDRVNSGWGVNTKDAVHSIHGASKRANKYSWEYTAGDYYWKTTYPSPLNNCEICHVPGSYDFENPKSTGAVPNLLWTTVATAQSTTTAAGTYLGVGSTTGYGAGSLVITTGTEVITSGNQAISPFVTAGSNYGAGYATNFLAANTGANTREAAGTTLVNSPYVGACTGCHDSNMALDHMRTNGGTFYGTRSSVINATTSTFDVTKIEQCFLCHSAGKIADVQKVHMTFK